MTDTLTSVGQTARMIEEDPGPVVQRLILGEELRQRREAASVGLDAANEDLNWYRGKLSKIENGNLALSAATDSTGTTRRRCSSSSARKPCTDRSAHHRPCAANFSDCATWPTCPMSTSVSSASTPAHRPR